MNERIRILGIDPSLRRCGWGVIEAQANRLTRIAHGVITPPAKADLAARLGELFESLGDIIALHRPDCAAVEDMFFKNNPNSAMKLGHARAICLLAPQQAGLAIAEYSARAVKKAVTGTGAADKKQVAAMVNMLLPSAKVSAGDAADALAVAICHAHHAPRSREQAMKASA